MPLPLPPVTSTTPVTVGAGADEVKASPGKRRRSGSPIPGASNPDRPPPVTGPRTGATAKGGVRTGTFLQLSAADQALATTLGVEVVVALKRAFAKVAELDPVDAERTLAMLAADREGQQRALGALFGRTATQVDSTWLARLDEAEAPAGRVTWELVQWARRKALSRATTGVHDSLVKLLRAELQRTSSPQLYWDALDGIIARKQRCVGSTGLGEYLAAHGCLAAGGVWTLVPEFIPGSDPIALLAGHPLRADAIPEPARRDRPVFAVWRKRLLDAGLLATEVWKSHMVSMYVARGVVGEWLRLLQLGDQPEAVGKKLVQGALVLTAPDGLWACRDSFSARAWCEANGHSARGLYHVPSVDGGHYGLLLTEVDVTALEPRGDRVAIARLDNVKAGDGHGGEARHQNDVVREALADPHLRFCVPNERGDAFEDLAPRLVRDAATLAAIRYDTVGPEGADEYSVQLPLTEVEITTLTQDLLRRALSYA